jgi:hypothetical protein
MKNYITCLVGLFFTLFPPLLIWWMLGPESFWQRLVAGVIITPVMIITGALSYSVVFDIIKGK